MFTPGRPVYLLKPNTSERVLVAGIATQVSAEQLVAEFAESISLQPTTNVFLYAELNRRFMQQPARVQAMLQAHPQPIIAFIPTGQPISAESRNTYRVSLAAVDVPARVAKDSKCTVLDVSATGFGVASHSTFKVGDTVNVSISYQGQSCSGEARIQSARNMGPDRFRYGLHAIEAPRGRPKNPLQSELGRICAAAQREQLRRLARA